jgi:putative oxidoreductase
MLRRLLLTTHDYSLTILRLVLGTVFFAHGAQKVLGWFGGFGFSASMNNFQQMGIPGVLAFLAIMAEFLGGLGLIIGFLGRVGAFGIICVMATAIFLVHARHGLFMNWSGTSQGEGFEFHLLALAIGFALLIRGSGAWSIDDLLTRHRPARIRGFGTKQAA